MLTNYRLVWRYHNLGTRASYHDAALGNLELKLKSYSSSSSGDLDHMLITRVW